jgi:hypothetical protein
LGLGVNKWVAQAECRAALLDQSLEGCDVSDSGAADFAAARAALDVALEEAASWEARHDPRALAARSEQSRIALNSSSSGWRAL